MTQIAESQKITAHTIITGHANADFDCLASMIAASKLYPGAVLIFPGSQEKNIRNFFIDSATYLFNFKSFKEIDPTSVKLLVMVDNRQRTRVPHVEPVFANPDLQIHVYDHHPDTEDDVSADFADVRSWGSCTSVIVDCIRQRNIDVTAEEATFLGIGIYEDTGSFSFNSTTQYDFEIAGWLRSKGMDVDVVADLITRDLDSEQITIMGSLIESATEHDINGSTVVIAECTTKEFVGDLAILVHKFIEMENIRVLFALARMKDRVHVVARSRSADVDVGRICKSLGGGGHAYAASASIKDKTLAQVKEELFGLLYSQVNPQILAEKLMNKPAVSLIETDDINSALDVMTHYGLKAAPVLCAGDCVGLLERDIVSKAIKHGLGDVAIGEYMKRSVQTVHRDTDFYAVMEIILSLGQRLVPVLDRGRIVGVITRTDLINTLIDEPARISESLLTESRRERNIGSIITERIPKQFLNVLEAAGNLAQEMGCEAYIVGGIVRDILLGEPNDDLDIVVEGDGIRFAEKLATRLGGRSKSHRKFKTAVIVLPDDTRVDVATARLEYYEYPAALPTVELSSIKMDLYRRDFTINALAVHINPDSFGRLVDFFGSQRDIKEKVIRVLHSLSFVEDPTRILRAIRFEQRFQFHIGPQTDRLIKNAIQLNFFHKLSGARVFHELRHILEGKTPYACFLRMESYKLLSAIHPSLGLTIKRKRLLEETEKVLEWYRMLYSDTEPEVWKIYFMGLCSGLDTPEVLSVFRRLALTKRHEREIISLRILLWEASKQLIYWGNREIASSHIYFMLEAVPLEGILFLMARYPKEPVRKYLSRFLTQLRHVTVDITGDDLIRLGVSPGPVFSDILKAVKAARLDGRAECREDQLALAKRIASGETELYDEICSTCALMLKDRETKKHKLPLDTD
ncbi:CBS domain-containing protein [Desulfovibrio inopinatus]|uniref:CBS domain-containing protein n=1 Tax=Desulfovibrio inopinatus TaxID=102109 RepID=UPI0004285690|nr:CBS domain-containing protein [Desulfovibrio inopinatus]